MTILLLLGRQVTALQKALVIFFYTMPVWQPRDIAARVVNVTQSPCREGRISVGLGNEEHQLPKFQKYH